MLDKFLAICIGTLYLASFAAPVAYVHYRKMDDFKPMHMTFWMTVFFPGFGQLIYIWYLHNYFLNDSKAKLLAKKQYEEYLEERRMFFKEYEAMQNNICSDSGVKRTSKEREESFFQAFPKAKLFIGPKHADDFEFIAESWMKFWGFIDAEKTLKGSDGGIDIHSESFIGQVKFYANSKVSRPEVQQLLGVAQSEGKGAVFFSYSNGYSQEALAFAEKNEVACFTFDLIEERNRFEFIASNDSAMKIVLGGEGMSYEEHVQRTSMEQIAQQYATQRIDENSFYSPPQRGFGFFSNNRFD